MLNLDIWMVETKVLQMPWGFLEKNDNFEHFWTSDAVFQPVFTGIAFCLTTAPLTGKHFCLSSSNHTHKALLIFSKNMSPRHADIVPQDGAVILMLPPLVIIFPNETVH
jgi:hypothetical protein